MITWISEGGRSSSPEGPAASDGHRPGVRADRRDGLAHAPVGERRRGRAARRVPGRGPRTAGHRRERRQRPRGDRRADGPDRRRGEPLHAVVSNVAFAKVVSGLDDLTKNALDLSVGYSAWPIVDLVQAARAVLGRFPRYVIGISSDADRWVHDGYDLVGASKAVLESLCRYLAVRLKPEGVRVNAIAPGLVDSELLAATFGEDVAADLRARGMMLDPTGWPGSASRWPAAGWTR